MLVIWSGISGSARHSRVAPGRRPRGGKQEKTRTGIEKLQGLTHAVARGLVAEHQTVHDAVVKEGIMVKWRWQVRWSESGAWRLGFGGCGCRCQPECGDGWENATTTRLARLSRAAPDNCLIDCRGRAWQNEEPHLGNRRSVHRLPHAAVSCLSWHLAPTCLTAQLDLSLAQPPNLSGSLTIMSQFIRLTPCNILRNNMRRHIHERGDFPVMC